MSAETQIALEAKNIYKNFGKFQALKDVNFKIARGKVVGFVGENGAGKTTTMRIFATLEEKDSGSALVRGLDAEQNPTEIRSILGWMPDNFSAYKSISVLEYLDFCARTFGLKGNKRHQRVADIMEFTDLQKISDRLIDKLSKGMGQRLCLGRSLINNPEILIMDEPAAGLDPRARIELKNLIRILAEQGKTILISSHILTELSEICDSIIFINQGKIIHHGDAEKLINSAEKGIIISFKVNIEPEEKQSLNQLKTLEKWLHTQPGLEFIEMTNKGGKFLAKGYNDVKLAELLKRMINADFSVCDFHRESVKLEDAFVDILSQKEKATGIEQEKGK